MLVGLLVLGVAIHFSSFSQNSTSDYEADLRDGSKQHHPLMAGRISLAQAVHATSWGQLACFGVLAWLSWGDWVMMLLVAAFILAGHVYNDRLAKVSRLGWVPICACWVALASWAMLLGGSFWWPYAVFVFTTVWFQIDVSGRLKDLGTGEPSWLKDLGARVYGGRFDPGGAWAYSGVLQGLQFASAAWLVAFWPGVGVGWLASVGFGAAVVCSIVMGFTWWRLTEPRVYNRDKDLAVMGLHEVAAAYLAVFAFFPLGMACVLLVLGFGWFLVFNRVLWRSALGPRV